jgi:cytochrome c-550 PedF
MQVKQQIATALGLVVMLSVANVWAHGDVTPQPIDTTGLEPIKDSDTTFADNNPYSGNPRAIEIGKHAFAQNCARCHGIDAISGGIAPDLREKLPIGAEGDEIFRERMMNGAIRNGVTYMPKFQGVVKQEGLWAIRSWLETVSVDAPAQAATASSSTTTSSTATPSASSSTTTSSTTTPAASSTASSSTATPAASNSTTTSSTTSTTPAASAEPSKETKPTASM